MRLFILRHGKAANRDDWQGEDAARPLTRGGVEQAELILNRLKPAVTASEILTSPWVRARQTAEIASQAWKLPLREVPWLAGGAATPAERVSQLSPRSDAVLVGHEPDLSELVRFLCGAQLTIKKCALVVLKGDLTSGGMMLHALLPPKLMQEFVG